MNIIEFQIPLDVFVPIYLKKQNAKKKRRLIDISMEWFLVKTLLQCLSEQDNLSCSCQSVQEKFFRKIFLLTLWKIHFRIYIERAGTGIKHWLIPPLILQLETLRSTELTPFPTVHSLMEQPSHLTPSRARILLFFLRHSAASISDIAEPTQMVLKALANHLLSVHCEQFEWMGGCC